MKERDAADRTRQEAAYTAANTKSQAQTDKENRWNKYSTWQGQHNYADPPPGFISFDFAAPSARRLKREQELNSAGLGVFSLGSEGANPTALAMEKQHMGDQFDRDAGAQYEGDLRNYDAQMRAEQGEIINTDIGQKMGILNNASGMSQFSTQARINTQPQSILPGLLSGLIGTAAQVGLGFATGGLSTVAGAAGSAVPHSSTPHF